MVDVKRALTYPLKDPNWIVKILIGSIPVIFPLFSLGYAFEVFKQALNKQELKLPEWDDWQGYLIKSLKLILIYLAYLAVPLILLSIGAVSLFGGAWGGLASMGGGPESGFEPAGLVAMGVGGVFMFIGGILAILLGLMVPMALANYAKNKEDLGAAFQFGVIVNKIMSIIGDYLLTTVIILGIAVAVGIVVAIVAFILGLIPFIGWLLILLIRFFINFVLLLVATFPLFGEACAAAYGAPSRPAAKA